MKNSLIIILALFALGACGSYSSFNQPKPVNEDMAMDIETEVEDSVKYELLIFDYGFESWFATRNLLSTARSNRYYKNWNQLYVSEWNRLYLQGHPYFENYIYYDPFEDYGFDINYKLYHYFRFVEEKTGLILVRR